MTETYRYFFECPRGFSNELTHYRIPSARTEEIEAHFAGRKDREFDFCNTDWDWGWTNDSRARRPGAAVDWDDRNWVF